MEFVDNFIPNKLQSLDDYIKSIFFIFFYLGILIFDLLINEKFFFLFYFILFYLEQKFEWGQNFNRNLIERVCNLDNAFYKNLIPAGAYKT